MVYTDIDICAFMNGSRNIMLEYFLKPQLDTELVHSCPYSVCTSSVNLQIGTGTSDWLHILVIFFIPGSDYVCGKWDTTGSFFTCIIRRTKTYLKLDITGIKSTGKDHQ